VKKRVRAIWHRITLRRHRSELWALDLAKKVGWLANLPISIMTMFWWFAFIIPVLASYLLGHLLIVSGIPVAKVFGYAILATASLYAIAALCVAAPWFFRWYFIAFGLTFERHGMADKKEAELVAAIAAAETVNRSN
jgi:hypothetical protein